MEKQASEKKPLPFRFLNGLYHNITFTLAGPKVRMLSIIACAAVWIFVVSHYQLFFTGELVFGPLLFVLCLLGGVAAGALIAFKIEVSKRYELLANTILFFLMPVATMQMMECFNGKFIYDFSPQTFFLNYLFYLFFYVVCLLITGRYHMTGLIVNITMYIFGLINYFTDLLRGTPFVPPDVLSFKTGMNVLDGYSYDISWQLILASLCMFLIYLINKKSVNAKPKTTKRRMFVKFLCAGYLAIFLLVVFGTEALPHHGYKPDFWDQSRGYHNTGTWLNFCLNLKYLHVRTPDGYDADAVPEIAARLFDEYGVDPDGDTSLNLLTGKCDYRPSSDKTPHIIMIMNESLADLRDLGELATNEDYMPFIHGLKENTIKGTLQVPVFGAGTSNTEFESLTGTSITFLTAGCNVYQSYVRSDLPSLVTTLKNQGYSTQAFHPYYKEGWNRINVYNHLGFEKYTAIEDFIDNDILTEYILSNDAISFANKVEQAYPGKDILLRRFVSDAYDYQMVEGFYEQRDLSKPFFIFNVTMQNHGGYAMNYRNFEQTIYALSTTKLYPMANRYLSLIKASDEAFKNLVSYYKTQEDPVIICMFGDHQPSIEDSFYEELLGSSLETLSLEQSQKRYATPFIIWANYDIPEATVEHMSSNYLSTLLLQTAGLKLTPFNKYLACLYQKLPVIDTVGYVDSAGRHYRSDEKSSYSRLLNEYACLEYNFLIDKKNRKDSFFTVAP